MNGMNGFQAMGDAATVVEGNVGELFLVRIVNAGQFDQSLHWHGNHFRVISRNGNRLSSFEWQDTINVKAGSTAMVLYQIIQPGHFPMHVHTAQMETSNGVYLNGTAAMIIGH
jgi:FtsP/CotA-like multicopper oxidase with cupredoxin domain